MDKMQFDKMFYEIYALLSIETVIPQYSQNMIKGEYPDWISNSDLGLEISRAENQHIGFTKGIINKYLGKPKGEIPNKFLIEFKGELIFEYYKGAERLFSVSDSKGLVSGARHIDFALNSTKNKLEKLNKHFRICKLNELYLFMSFTTDSYDLNLFLTKYRDIEQDFSKKFSIIYLFDNSALHIISTNNYLVETKNYSESCLTSLNQKSIAMRNAVCWDDGTKFYDVLLTNIPPQTLK